MPVFRTEKVKDYAVIAKHHLKNKNLSYKAKGLLTFMLSVPDDWDYSLYGLSTLSSDGIDGVRSGIRELEKHGYLTRRRIRDAGGKLGDIEYTVHEIPQPPGNDEIVNPSREPPSNSNEPPLGKPILENPILVEPTSEKPILGFPTLDKPTQENPTQLSNKALSNNGLSINESNNKQTLTPSQKSAENGSINQLQLSLGDCNFIPQQDEHLTVQTAQGAGIPVDHAMTLVEQQFEIFWRLYPRKAGKKAARKTWTAIAPDQSLFSTVINALNSANLYWRNHNISQKHIPHPSTWLDEERWEDELPATHHQDSNNLLTPSSNQEGVGCATVGADYTIGGENDPYRHLTTDQ